MVQYPQINDTHLMIHIKKLKNKNNIITSIDIEKDFDKIQY